MPRALDITGQRFGRLVAIRSLGVSCGTGIKWECQCDCGRTHVACAGHLRAGGIRSCGCSHKEASRRAGAQSRRHGMTHSPEFLTWRGIKSRCKNPKTPAYAYYGGRGITVCDRWDASFEAFYEDMGPRPPGATIDRIDNSKGYEPGNCRWADLATQAVNRTDNVVIEFGGEKKCLAEWERSRGFRQGTLAQRLRKGWTVERAITTPVRPMKKKEAK